MITFLIIIFIMATLPKFCFLKSGFRSCDPYHDFLNYANTLKMANMTCILCTKASCDFKNQTCNRTSRSIPIPMYNGLHQVAFLWGFAMPKRSSIRIRISKTCTVEFIIKKTADGSVHFFIRNCFKKWPCDAKPFKIWTTKGNFGLLTIKNIAHDSLRIMLQTNPTYPGGSPEKTFFEPYSVDCLKWDQGGGASAVEYHFEHNDYSLGDTFFNNFPLMLPCSPRGFYVDPKTGKFMQGETLFQFSGEKDTKKMAEFIQIDANKQFPFFRKDRQGNRINQNTNFEPIYIQDGKAVDVDHIEEIPIILGDSGEYNYKNGFRNSVKSTKSFDADVSGNSAGGNDVDVSDVASSSNDSDNFNISSSTDSNVGYNSSSVNAQNSNFPYRLVSTYYPEDSSNIFDKNTNINENKVQGKSDANNHVTNDHNDDSPPLTGESNIIDELGIVRYNPNRMNGLIDPFGSRDFLDPNDTKTTDDPENTDPNDSEINDSENIDPYDFEINVPENTDPNDSEINDYNRYFDDYISLMKSITEVMGDFFNGNRKKIRKNKLKPSKKIEKSLRSPKHNDFRDNNHHGNKDSSDRHKNGVSSNYNDNLTGKMLHRSSNRSASQLQETKLLREKDAQLKLK